LLYLIPIVATLWFDLFFVQKTSLNTMALGIFLSLMGSLCIFWILSRAFSNIPKGINQSAPADKEDLSVKENTIKLECALDDALKENENLREDLKNITIALEVQMNDQQHFSEEARLVRHSFEEYRKETSDQLEQQQALIRQLQGTIAEQKSNIEKRQQQIGLLDTKVNDLTCEIKTLLKSEEGPQINQFAPQMPPSPNSREIMRAPIEKHISSAEEASSLLKRCLDISQKITGSFHFNSHVGASLDSAADNYTLDLRRLCDILRSEGRAGIILYSPKDNQLLFANNHIKTLTGWSPEKFIQNFTDIVTDSTPWRQGISGLAIRNEVQTKLIMKPKVGQDLLVHVHLGLIPTGIFRHHAIAIVWHPNIDI